MAREEFSFLSDEEGSVLDRISEGAINGGVEHLLFHGTRSTPMMVVISSEAEQDSPQRDATMLYQVLMSSLPKQTMDLLATFIFQHMEIMSRIEAEGPGFKEDQIRNPISKKFPGESELKSKRKKKKDDSDPSN